MSSQENYGLEEQFYSCLYRGIVKGGPNAKGVLAVQVPQLHGESILDAMPCVAQGTTPHPTIGKGVWIMFEAGDPAQPVWLGVWSWV